MISPISYLKILGNLISDLWLCIITGATMTIKGGTNKACAACKYQRRRCSKECPLAPYFPADQPKSFSNAHRLFGVANIKKILDQVEPKQRDEAMKSIIFESDMRARYPVSGCLGISYTYKALIANAIEELRYLNTRLAIHREQFHYHNSHQMSPPPPPPLESSSANDTLSMLATHLQYGNNNSEVVMFDGGGDEVYGLQQYFNPMAAQSSSDLIVNQPEMDPIEYEDINPYNVMVDDKQLFIEYREPCESSKESEGKHHMEHGSRNELRSAAAYLGLTSVKG